MFNHQTRWGDTCPGKLSIILTSYVNININHTIRDNKSFDVNWGRNVSSIWKLSILEYNWYTGEKKKCFKTLVLVSPWVNYACIKEFIAWAGLLGWSKFEHEA